MKKPGFKISESINILSTENSLVNTDIFVAMGDLQCSFYSCCDENETNTCGKKIIKIYKNHNI